MDLVMPGMDGITALAEVKRVAPASEVLVLTSFADDSKVFPALRAGASGFMLKTASSSGLGQASRALKKGRAGVAPGNRPQAHARHHGRGPAGSRRFPG